MGNKIKKVIGREVLDSRGNPTVEVEITTNSFSARAIVPSGASTGTHEAVELRDNEKRYGGKGVLKAVNNVNRILSKKIIGEDCAKQSHIDNLLIEADGTENKEKIGANAILAVSIAVCKAGAISSNISLHRYIKKISANKKRESMPVPQMNIINSGKHIGVENDIQEHMMLPSGFRKFSDALQAGTETYHSLKKILKNKFGPSATLLGDEGGFAPPIKKVEQRLNLIMEAIESAGYNKKIKIGLDCASSEFYKKADGSYIIIDKNYTKEELVGFYEDICRNYPIASIEDGMAEDDWEGWQLLNKKLGKKIQLVGDDLLVTNIRRIIMAADKNACNSLLLKVNQIGTITESIDAASIAFKNKWNVVVSHRSGETEDSFISDLAVGIGAQQVKFGAPARGERTAKYNQLLRIEEEIKK